MDFYEAFLPYIDEITVRENVIVCGDVNTAHKAIDLARPKEMRRFPVFLPEERAWIDT
jgi:exodeoxyribonuclease-3